MKGMAGDSVIKTSKRKLNKNKSFSGVEFNKSPKSRRKSLATVLPTPLKHQKSSVKVPRRKKETILNEWVVNEEECAQTTTILSTPKSIKKKKKLEKTKSPVGETERKGPKAADTVKDKSQNVSVSKIVKKKKPKVQANVSIKHLKQQFDVKSKNIKEAVKGVIKFRSENPKLQNQLFEESVPLYLQISCHKIPSGNSKILRIPVANSVLTPDDEICLIVPDVKGIKNMEHEKHVEHYEELLRKKGVENIKTIMTFHEFRTEYETYEQKSRLVNLYDIFLADGRICGKVVSKCGNAFYARRKVPTPVKLQVTKLKEHIDKALSKVFCHLHLKGDSYIVQFGHNKMDIDDLVENIFSIMGFLSREFPGGFDNIKGLHVYAARAPSIPIYMSFKNPNEVKAPKLKSKKPKSYKSYSDELTTKPNAKVTVRPSGKVFVTALE